MVGMLESYKEKFEGLKGYRVDLAVSAVKSDMPDILTVNPSDIIGHQVQGLCRQFLVNAGFKVRDNPNSQEFPDMYVTDISVLKDSVRFFPFIALEKSLEIKCFNALSAPAFDLGNFVAFIDGIIKDPNRLNADYCVIGYRLAADSSSYEIAFVNVYKIWELAGVSVDKASGKTLIRTQNKRGVPYNIRPRSLKKAVCFTGKKEFLVKLLDSYVHWFGHTEEGRVRANRLFEVTLNL